MAATQSYIKFQTKKTLGNLEEEEELEETKPKGLKTQDISEDKSDKEKDLFGNFFVKSCENSNCCLMLSLLDFVFGIY